MIDARVLRECRAGFFAEAGWASGSPRLERYNGQAALSVSGDAADGHTTGQAMAEAERLLQQLPAGIGFEWSGASREERKAGGQSTFLYSISILFVFLFLAAVVPARAAEDDKPILPDVVYGHKDGMALTFDVIKPAKPNGDPIDHIQFRWVSYATSSYDGNSSAPCSFTDRRCVGFTELWR